MVNRVDERGRAETHEKENESDNGDRERERVADETEFE